MFIFSLFKWSFYIISGIILLIFFALIVFRFVDKQAPINEHKKTCLVTGASYGIGLEISRQMVKKGWKVLGIASSQDRLKDLERELGPSFIPYVCDVGDSEKINDVCLKIKKQKLEPTLFFLNAGISNKDSKYEFSQKLHRETFNTNYFGVITWVQDWLNDVKIYGGGTFVAISSIISLSAMPGTASFSASKVALNICFQSLRLQYLTDNIGFFIVLPGPIDTEIFKDAPTGMPFTHKASDEAAYIIKKVFNGTKQIEPSWYYSFYIRLFNCFPDKLLTKIFR